MTAMAIAVARAGLLRCSEPPVTETVAGFVRAVGAVDAWQSIIHRRAPEPVLSAVRARLGANGPEEWSEIARADVVSAERWGARIIGPGDDEWPAEPFAALAWVRPYEQCPTAAEPLALYVQGAAVPSRANRAVSIVGSRAATPGGARIAAELAADAVAAGRTVVSGAAFGIDASAHRGALGLDPVADDLESGSSAALPPPTLAVLPCGIDRYYPTAHRALLQQIARDGTVISEYAPGAVPARHRFLIRNRLIAALGEATIVVEAGRRSGSLNTATTAANLGRVVCSVPGPISSAMSVGCHDLIRAHKAELVCDWEHISDLIGPIHPDASPHRAGSSAVDMLDLISGRVYEAFPARDAVSLDQLTSEAALAVPDVLSALTVLRSRGLVDRRDGLWIRLDVDHRSRAAATARQP